MTTEIKVAQSEVRQLLSKMKASANAITPAMPKEIGAGNELKVVTTLNELNDQLEQMLTSYKEMALHHEALSQKAVEEMEETDRELSFHTMPR
ncbi:YwqI/YxiC family protein [Rossellomorea marisflavi]|uniref:YwqI/YxiC family protein n=1 Tax=Rossellomorea marisflavi TaxID=189381 RepID=A0A161T480_9BACI|nr:YwqI/YxiC family protein [Rossellomorea marisflavi]KMK95661.1 hypothetical protein VL03_05560 [Rossellomorea marisflavi]KZE44230.1 hypothetical protein AV649_07980 [Rossellomorea marisflavi]